ncbi:MAG: hypothetical protein CR982_05200 [Candidatus Cloacimonadota bacterium]|nr:MAG: hypothetical protein CR982_05200 [Candidatus Cloacimonadota bacterium]PIE78559.1 MAG: hypothetical protein CSA15_07180 [Candidatus Delongbacteria bacterium]
MKYIIICLITISYLFSDDISSDMDYGVRLYNEKLYDVAITQFSSFIERNPESSLTPKASYYLSLVYKEIGDIDSREQSLKQILIDFPESEQALTALNDLSEIYLDKDPLKASKYLLQAKVFFAGSKLFPSMIYKAISILYKNGDIVGAKREINYMKRSFPYDLFTIKARAIEANILLDKNQFVKGQDIFKKLLSVAKDEQKSEVYYLYGIYLKRSGAYSEARKTFLKVIEDGSKKEDSYFSSIIEFSKLAMLDKIYSKVFKLLSKVDKVPKKFKPEYYALLGEVEYHKGSFKSSFKSYKEAYKLNNNVEYLLKGAKALGEDGNYEDAGDFLKRYANKDVGGEELIALSAQLYIEGGNIAKGVGMFKTLYRKFPQYKDLKKLLFLIGKTYYDLGNYGAAFDELETFVKIYPSSFYSDDGAFLLAESALILGENEDFYYHRALKYFEMIVEKFPASDFYNLSLQRIKFLKENKIKPSNIFEKVSTFVSDSGNFSEKAKFCYYDLKDYKLAYKLLKDIKNTDNEIKLIRSLALLKSGSKDKNEIQRSLDYLSKSLDSNIDRDRKIDIFFTRESSLSLIYSGEELSDLRDNYYIETINKGLDNSEGVILYNYCKTLFYNSKDTKRVIKFCKSYSLKYPNSEYSNEVNFYMASIYAKKGDLDSSISIFKSIIDKGGKGRFTYFSIDKLLKTSLDLSETVKYVDILKRDFFYMDLSRRGDIIVADAYLNEKKYKSSVSIYQKIYEDYDGMEKGGDYIYICLKLAEINDLLDNRKSEMYLKEAYSLASDKSTKINILTKLSQFYEKSGNLRSLKHTLSEISGLNNGKGAYESNVILGDIEFNNRNYKKSLKIYKNAFDDKEGEKDTNLAFKIAVNYLRTDDVSSGKKVFDSIKDEVDDEIKSKFYLEAGNSYLRKKNYDRALNNFVVVTDNYKKSSSYPEAKYGTALIYYNIGKQEEAFDTWKDVVKKYPNSNIFVEANYYLGSLYLKRDMIENAIGALQNVVSYEGEHRLKKFAYNQLIKLYKKLSFNDSALKATREYIELYPEGEDIFDKRIEIGVLLQKNRDFDRALEYFHKLKVNTDGEDELATQFYIAETYMLKGEFRRAISEFLKVKFAMINKTPYDWKITAVYKAAQCYEKISEFDKAIALYEEIIKKYDLSTKYGRQAQKSIDKIKKLVE